MHRQSARAVTFLRSVYGKGLFHLLTANFFIGFIGFGSQLLVAKFLSPLDLGRIKTIQTFANIAILLGCFGYDTAVLKLCSENYSPAEKSFMFRRSLRYVLIPAAGVVVILAILSLSGRLSPDKAVNRLMLLYMFVVPSTVISTMFVTFIQALKKIQLIAKIQTMLRVASLFLVVSATYLFHLSGYISAIILVSYVSLVPFYFVSRDVLVKPVKVDDFYDRSRRYGGWSLAANFINTLSNYMDIFLLNFLIKEREKLGFYGLSTIFIMALTLIPTTTQTIALPYFSEKSGDREEFVRVLRRYQGLLAGGAAVIVILCWFTVPFFIRIIYGPTYALAGWYFRLLSLKFFFYSCTALMGVAVVGLGQMKYNFLTVLISFPLNLSLSCILISRFSFTGAAIAQICSAFAVFVIVLVTSKRAIQVHFAQLPPSPRPN